MATVPVGSSDEPTTATSPAADTGVMESGSVQESPECSSAQQVEVILLNISLQGGLNFCTLSLLKLSTK